MNVLGIATPKSNNRKTGPMAAIYRPVGVTCPSSCPLLNNGCYAQRGPAAIHQKRSEEKTFTFEELIEKMPCNVNIIRLNVTGDFLDENGNPDVAYINALRDAAKKNPNIIFYGYTHAWDILAKHFADMPDNVHVLASVNNKEDAEKAKAMGWHYARVTSEYDRQDNEVYCPVDKAKKEKRKPNITCKECGLCFQQNKRDIVFFKV